MTFENIFEKIKEIILAELNVSKDVEITPETSFSEIGLDSIALMQLFVFLEENFHFEFGEDSFVGNDKFKKLTDISNYILLQISKN